MWAPSIYAVRHLTTAWHPESCHGKIAAVYRLIYRLSVGIPGWEKFNITLLFICLSTCRTVSPARLSTTPFAIIYPGEQRSHLKEPSKIILHPIILADNRFYAKQPVAVVWWQSGILPDSSSISIADIQTRLLLQTWCGYPALLFIPIMVVPVEQPRL